MTDDYRVNKALACPICGAQRWTIEQMKNHIVKKHGAKKK